MSLVQQCRDRMTPSYISCSHVMLNIQGIYYYFNRRQEKLISETVLDLLKIPIGSKIWKQDLIPYVPGSKAYVFCTVLNSLPQSQGFYLYQLKAYGL